jgi:hypothetical protein
MSHQRLERPFGVFLTSRGHDKMKSHEVDDKPSNVLADADPTQESTDGARSDAQPIYYSSNRMNGANSAKERYKAAEPRPFGESIWTQLESLQQTNSDANNEDGNNP